MRAPVNWLRELVAVPADATGEAVAADLVRVGLEEEGLHTSSVRGPLVVGRVLDRTDEPQKNGKTVHFCHVDVGNTGQRAAAGGDPAVTQEIVCGAHNFAAGDLVAVILPGGELSGFTIGARKTYGHMSNGMICSQLELGIGEDHDGIIVLGDYFADRPDVLAALEPGQDAMPLFGLDEEVVEVNVTPDRGYCFSLRGIAREYALSTGRSGAYADPVAIDVPSASDAGWTTGHEVRLEDDAPIRGRLGCDRYVARVVRGVNPLVASPAWMQRRLTQMGMRPIALAVDVTNYLMLLTGQPLHAFDLDTLTGPLVVRRARPGERLTTLDDVERTLDPEDLLITDSGTTPLVIAGVMGGANCEVSASTHNVLVEAAHFDHVSISRSSRRHRLSSEASKRFERGVDPDMTAAVAELAVRLLVELGGGTPDAAVTDVDLREERVGFAFDTALAPALIEPDPAPGRVPDGLDHDAVVAILRSIGCVVTDAASGGPAGEALGEAAHETAGAAAGCFPASAREGFAVMTVLPPSWRPDLVNGPDLVEEVARIRGYDRIPSVLPAAPSGRGLTPGQRRRRLVATALTGLGLTEVLSYPFVAASVFDDLGIPAEDSRRRAVRLVNPLSDEQPLLRTNLLQTLLPTLRLNVNRGQRDVALFEVGTVFRPGAGTAGVPDAAPVPPVGEHPGEATIAAIEAAVPAQPRHLAMALTGDATPAGPWGPARPWTAADAIDLARQVGRALGVPLTVRADTHAPWHPGRCAAFVLPDGDVVGRAGELHPKVVGALDLPARTCAVELRLDAILAAADEPIQARRLSTYPVAHSDVALVVGEDVPSAAVESTLRDGAGELLESVALFDVFRGEQVGAGKKSLAYRLSFRASDRTLTTEEVSAARDAAVAAAGAAYRAVQR